MVELFSPWTSQSHYLSRVAVLRVLNSVISAIDIIFRSLGVVALNAFFRVLLQRFLLMMALCPSVCLNFNPFLECSCWITVTQGLV